MNKINISEELFDITWKRIDWLSAERKLADWQRELTIAAFRKDTKLVTDIQKRIVRDLDVKCLAVRHVAASGSGPGVDGVRWRTPSQMMRAAISLTSKDYHATPLRQILLVAKNTGKERRAGIPTYYDRAMQVLYGYSLLPVVEATAERKSFAFRNGRSTQDAQAYILKMLKGRDAPNLVVCTDIKACFASIQHSWLLSHAPMDRRVLREFLAAGYVFAGELFPSDGYGISEGSNLSPYLGNFALDGLQAHIYRGLHGTLHPVDYADGNLVRFADDIFVTIRTEEGAARVLELLKEFLTERGLKLSEDKTKVCSVLDGFNFLGQTFIRKGGLMYSYPSEKAVERFIANIRETIQVTKKSQRELIALLNQKLRGWANYHRFSDAGDAFRRVDAAVQTALLEAALARHPKLSQAKVIAKYWYKEASGRHCYALPEDKSIRVIRLEDTLLLQHHKVKTNVNPFVDTDYVESRTHEKEIKNVTGPYRAIWERQKGCCFYCGRPILKDQPRTTVVIDHTRAGIVKNSAYIHKLCEPNQFEMIQTMEDVETMRPFDILAVLKEVEGIRTPRGDGSKPRKKNRITPNWKHYGFKQYLAACNDAYVSLTFAEIEKLDGRAMPKSSKNQDWWTPRDNCNTIAEAWITEGYSLKTLDIPHKKITLKRDLPGLSNLRVPDALLNKRLPEDAVFELERHMEYIIDKYGL